MESMPSRKGVFTGARRTYRQRRVRNNGTYDAGAEWGSLHNARALSRWERCVWNAWAGVPGSGGESRGTCWARVTREARPRPWFPVQCATAEASAGIPGAAHPRCCGCRPGTSQPVSGRRPEALQTQSQVVGHTWRESKKSASHVPL